MRISATFMGCLQCREIMWAISDDETSIPFNWTYINNSIQWGATKGPDVAFPTVCLMIQLHILPQERYPSINCKGSHLNTVTSYSLFTPVGTPYERQGRQQTWNSHMFILMCAGGNTSVTENEAYLQSLLFHLTCLAAWEQSQPQVIFVFLLFGPKWQRTWILVL